MRRTRHAQHNNTQHKNNTRKKKYTSLCPRLQKNNPLQTIPPCPYKTTNSNGRPSNQTAVRTSPWHENTLAAHTALPNQRWWRIFCDTHTNTNTNTLLVASEHCSAALLTHHWWCILKHTHQHQHTPTASRASRHRLAAVPTHRWWCIIKHTPTPKHTTLLVAYKHPCLPCRPSPGGAHAKPHRHCK